MKLRILLFVSSLFVDVFAGQLKWEIHNDVNSWNNDVDLMSQELLIPVKTKTVTKPKPVKIIVPSKPQIDQSKKELVQSPPKYVKPHPSPAAQSPLSFEDELSSEEFMVVKQKKKLQPGPKTKPKPTKSPKSVSTQDIIPPINKQSKSPCVDTDTKCQLLAKEELLAVTPAKSRDLNNVKENKTLEISVKLESRGYADSMTNTHHVAKVQQKTKDPLQQNLLILPESEFDESDDDIINSISDEAVNRIRRQTGGDGGSGAGFFEESTATEENPEFEISLTTTLKTPLTSGVLSETDKTNYRAAFQKEMAKRFRFIPGFKRIEINPDDITLNGNNQPKANFRIVIDGGAIGALGSDPEARLQNLRNQLRQAESVLQSTGEILGNPTIPTNIEIESFIKRVEILLSDVCESTQPCKAGYVCQPNITAVGDYAGSCVHACYFTKLNTLCQNSATCTLDADSQPYCQCGTQHSGAFCENSAAVDGGTVSTAEAVGISLGTVLALAALASCCFFIFFCRKKNAKDMDYSYYGDDDNLMQGYLDQSSNLGISNMYIDRPRVSIQPLDIYNDQTMA